MPMSPLPLTPGSPVSVGSGICFADDHSPASSAVLQDLKNIYKLFIYTTIKSDTIGKGLFLRGRLNRENDRYFCGGSIKTVKDALSAHKVSPEHVISQCPVEIKI